MNEFEYISPLWRLADPLTVEQAAALIAGYDPNVIRYDVYGGVYFEDENGKKGRNGSYWVQTALSALKNAVSLKKLKARLIFPAQPRFEAGTDNMMERGYWNNEDIKVLEDAPMGTEYVINTVPDWEKTLVGRDDLKIWLTNNGIRTGFFFPDSREAAADYLDTNNPRYAPKLAAAVKAWQSVTDVKGKTPKQAIVKWLREHAAEFGLSDDEGKPNETGIEEVAKVANWQPAGGAPKTLG